MNLWNEDAEEEQDNKIYTMRDDGKDGDRDDKEDKDREVKFRNLWNMGKKMINNEHHYAEINEPSGHIYTCIIIILSDSNFDSSITLYFSHTHG